MKIGIIGCGAIGGQLAQSASCDRKSPLVIHSVTDVDQTKANQLAQALRPHPRVLSVEQAAGQCDMLVETAGKNAVPVIAHAALQKKTDLMILSIGALLEHPGLVASFRKKGCGLYFPSGAIAGLDALKAAATQSLHRVQLETRKHPRSLAGAPYFLKKKLDPNAIRKATRIFSGSAARAIQLFPANVNIAAAVSIVGLGAEKTRVTVIADPTINRNIHTLQVRGDFGQFTTVTENRPSQENPKTSRLAAAAALAMLNAIARGERFGT